jgi:alpha-D-xyloside xylohydrolase
MSKQGWVYTKNVENKQKDWVGYVSTFYDVFNPEARRYFWGKMKEKLYSKGFDAWWMDATEPDILSNTSIEARKKLMEPLCLGPSAEYFNAYSLMNSKAVYEGQRNVDPDKRVFILTRSAYAGQQRYASATWSGDVASRWYDLKAQISAGLNFSVSGIPYWTSDIGGFSLERRYENAQGEDLNEWRELNTRWYQFGAFCPLFRVHGQYPYREIFNIAPEDHPAYKSMLYYDRLRYRLMPYIYTLAGNTYRIDYTIMRALVMDFPDDTNVLNIGDQFMFGPSIMVCPVYGYQVRSREVYLPAGQGWYDFYTGRFFEGGQTITAAAPYERIPLFVKEGSIIPIGPEVEYALQRNNDELILWVYGGADAEFDLYEDENINYNYEKGDFGLLPFSYSESTKELKLGRQQGIFRGMPENRNIGFLVISIDKPIGFSGELKPVKSIEYIGDEMSILLQ